MSNPSDPNASRKPLEQQLNEAGARVEEELKRVIRYVDDEVIPEVRRHGSTALRVAADRLRELAEHMDERPGNSGAAAPPPPSEPPRS